MSFSRGAGPGPITIFWPDQAAAVQSAADQTINSTASAISGVVGCNAVSDERAWGIEADYGTFSSSGRQQNSGIFPSHNTFLDGESFTVKSEINTDRLFTLRARYGMLRSDWFSYLTGGLAVARVRGNFQYADSAGRSSSTSLDDSAQGWTLGLGFERAMQGHWSIKAEYLFAWFGDISTENASKGVIHSVELTTHIVRAGLNYRF
jgi:opacity protein-like surface antigen